MAYSKKATLPDPNIKDLQIGVECGKILSALMRNFIIQRVVSRKLKVYAPGLEGDVLGKPILEECQL